MKVGKAIYNILSQSKDVQSNFPFNTTDYSPTGTELVTNGDFSAAGSNLVDNPNFTDTGADLLTQPIDLTVDFIANSGGVIDDSNSFTTAGGSVDGIVNKVTEWNLVEGNSYKLVIEGSTTSSGFTIGNYLNGDEYGTGFGTHYFVAEGGEYATRLWIRQQTAGTTDLTTFTIEELGEDWTLFSDVSVGEDKLICDNVAENTSIASQSGIVPTEKSVKVSYDVVVDSGAFRLLLGSGGTTTTVTTSGTYVFYETSGLYGTLTLQARSGGFDGSITNIVVQELGEGWNLSAVGGISFNGGGLSLDSSEIDTSGGGTVYSSCTQVGTVIEIGKSYKLVIDNLDITSGNIELKFGLDHTTTPVRPVLTSADNGTYTDYFTAQTLNDGFTINSIAGTVATLSSISVEEMVLNKIFPELAPPDIDAPYVVYSVVSNSPSETKNTNGDIDTASIEVYGFQDTYNKAVDLGVSVRAALDRKTGTYNTIEIQSTNYVNEQMDVNEARKLWAAIQDYSIRIKNL